MVKAPTMQGISALPKPLKIEEGAPDRCMACLEAVLAMATKMDSVATKID